MKRRVSLAVVAVLMVAVACSDRYLGVTAPLIRGPRAVFNSAPVESPYGINVGWLVDMQGRSFLDNRLDTITTLIQEAGIAWIRIDLPWAYIQSYAKWEGVNPCDTTRTSRDTSLWTWAPFDATVQRATNAGLNILGVLGLFTPSDESQKCGGGTADSTAGFYNPMDWSAWEEFVRVAVARYPQIKYWEIWNEPNAQYPFYLGCLSPYCNYPTNVARAYADLVEHAAPIIKNAGGYVIGPGTGDGGSGSLAPATFTGDVMGYVGSDVDFISFHAYGSSIPTLASAIATASDPHTSSPRNFWVTEAGYYTDAGSQSAISADLTTRMSALWQAPRVQKIFYWHAYADTNCYGEGGQCSNDARHIIGGYGSGGISRLSSWYTYRDIIMPPVYVTMFGNSTVEPYLQCPWYASVTGGTPPFDYQWSINGTNTGPNWEVFDYTNGGSSFTIGVKVTDASGRKDSTSMAVTVSSGWCE